MSIDCHKRDETFDPTILYVLGVDFRFCYIVVTGGLLFSIAVSRTWLAFFCLPARATSSLAPLKCTLVL